MLINKKLFTKKDLDNYPCSRCNTGIFEIRDYREFELVSDDKNYYFQDFVFTSFLKCNKCNNIISICGNKSSLLNNNSKYEYIIKGLSAPINIFTIPRDCPDNIKKVIRQSFGLFWVNYSSCANKIRLSLELIMKEQLTEEEYNSVDSLNKRIDVFSRKNNKIGKYIEAVKWGGNQGSHIDDNNLTEVNVLDMYELLSKVLEDLYNDTDSKLEKIRDEIIDNKGFT